MTQPPIDLNQFYAEIEASTEEAVVRGALRGMIRVLPVTADQRSTAELQAELARRMAALRPAPVEVTVSDAEPKKKRAG